MVAGVALPGYPLYVLHLRQSKVRHHIYPRLSSHRSEYRVRMNSLRDPLAAGPDILALPETCSYRGKRDIGVSTAKFRDCESFDDFERQRRLGPVKKRP